MRFKRILAAVIAVMMLAGMAFAETIGAGSDAEAIREVQTKLKKVSLLTQDQISGEWDDATVHAMLRFQRFVNNVQGAGTVEETGDCDDTTSEYLEYASSQYWNVADQVALDEVHTAEEQAAIDEAAAEAEAEAKAAEEEAARQKAIDDQATIAYVQSMLRQVGLLDDVNGEYDDATKDAIMRAQQYVNETQGEGTVEVNGAYDDPETMAWLNRGAEDGWTIPRTGALVTPEPTEEPAPGEETEETGEETGEETREDGQADAEATAEAAAAPAGPVGIENFEMMVNGEIREGKVELEPGTYSISWSGDHVAMFSMYMYDGDGNLLNKNENMSVNGITLDTIGMSEGVTYEIRVGAVPEGGQVENMEWRSLYLTLK